MKNKTLFLFWGLLFITSLSSAQKLHIGLGGGFGTFKMSDSRNLNQTVIESLPFGTNLTDDFPPYFLYNGEIIYSFPKIFSLGIKASTTSTGSRVCVSDYSGSYVFDNLQKVYTSGLKAMTGTFPGHKQGICFSLEGGVIWSFLSLKEDFTVFDKSTNSVTDYRAFGYYVQPGIDYLWQVMPWLMVGGNLSYFKGFPNNYYLKDDKEKTLYNTKTNKPISPQWDGVRASISVYYQVIRKKDKK